MESGLTMEYQTDEATYYVLPNISKSLLLKKSRFMEANMQLLGLLSFQFVSLSESEVAQRSLAADAALRRSALGIDSFEESVAGSEFEGDYSECQ